MNGARRIGTVILYAIGAGAALNGVWMLVDAPRWFAAIASRTGELNVHLVRDVGAAYLTAGVALLWAARRPALRGPLAAIAGLFLGLHAATHLFEAAVGVIPPSHVLEDFPGVHLPALLVIGLALASLRRPAEI